MIEKRIKATHRLFFALFPPPIVARQVVEAMAPFAEGARMMRPERLHVTLDIFDDFAEFPDEVAQALIAAGSAVAAAPFEIVLDQVTGSEFSVALRSRLKNAPLAALRRAIVAARDGMGVAGRHGYAFSPHMTLIYRKGGLVNQSVAPVIWSAEEFALIHSLIGQTRHEVIGRWPLAGAAAQDDGQLPLL